MKPKFTSSAQSFHSELKRKVQAYFDETKLDVKGGGKLYTKALVFITVHICTYLFLILFTPPVWLALPCCVLLGLSTAAIGFNIMHDGSHGSLSKSPLVNKLSACTLDFLGASSYMWNSKHNIIHHTYTNIEGMDDDIEAGIFLRLAPAQRHYKMHRYQHLYFWALYGLLYLFWVFFTDYKKYFRQKVGNVPIPKMAFTDHLMFWAFKINHIALYVLLPIYLVGFWSWLVGFTVYAFSCGFVLSIVFQLAHTVTEASFPQALQPENKMQDEWALHQLKTTANFATDNKIITWLIGGLNYQVEHHLFPKISHIHYPAISKIIKKYCEDRGLPYLEHSKMQLAIQSHRRHLKAMGRS